MCVVHYVLQLQQRLEAKRNFVRFISHEIRTPLNTVSMGLQLAIRDIRAKMTEVPTSGDMEATAKPVLPPAALTSVSPPEDSLNAKVLQGFLQMVEELNDSCEIAISLLNDILIYDKLDGKDLKLNTSDIDVKTLIVNNCKGFANQVQ